MACAAYHDETVRNVKAKRVQCDEIWSFTYAKAKGVKTAKAAPVDAQIYEIDQRFQQEIPK
jgi:hypothetical protein